MRRAEIRHPFCVDIPEKERIALAALEAPIEHGKFRFAAFEILVEIDEESEHALSMLGYLFRVAGLR
jgi:hypothetical protein